MQTIALVRAKVRRKIKMPKLPPFFELLAYTFLASDVLALLIDESQHHSSWMPFRNLIDQCGIFCIFVGTELLFSKLLTGKAFPLRTAIRRTWGNIFWLPFFILYIGAFVVTLALHFPFAILWWWQ